MRAVKGEKAKDVHGNKARQQGIFSISIQLVLPSLGSRAPIHVAAASEDNHLNKKHLPLPWSFLVSSF